MLVFAGFCDLNISLKLLNWRCSSREHCTIIIPIDFRWTLHGIALFQFHCCMCLRKDLIIVSLNCTGTFVLIRTSAIECFFDVDNVYIVCSNRAMIFSVTLENTLLSRCFGGVSKCLQVWISLQKCQGTESSTNEYLLLALDSEILRQLEKNRKLHGVPHANLSNQWDAAFSQSSSWSWTNRIFFLLLALNKKCRSAFLHFLFYGWCFAIVFAQLHCGLLMLFGHLLVTFQNMCRKQKRNSCSRIMVVMQKVGQHWRKRMSRHNPVSVMRSLWGIIQQVFGEFFVSSFGGIYLWCSPNSCMPTVNHRSLRESLVCCVCCPPEAVPRRTALETPLCQEFKPNMILQSIQGTRQENRNQSPPCEPHVWPLLEPCRGRLRLFLFWISFLVSRKTHSHCEFLVHKWSFRNRYILWQVSGNEAGMDPQSVFRPSATVSRIGLMESHLHRCHGGPPLAGYPPTWWMVGALVLCAD